MNINELTIKYFNLIYPSIDINSPEFKADAYSVFSKYMKVDRCNYSFVVKHCLNFLREAQGLGDVGLETKYIYKFLFQTICEVLEYIEGNISDYMRESVNLCNTAREIVDSSIRLNTDCRFYEVILLHGINICEDTSRVLDKTYREEMRTFDECVFKYLKLIRLLGINEERDNVINKMICDRYSYVYEKAILDLDTFYFCLTSNDIWLNAYIVKFKMNEYKHYFNVVERIVKENNPDIINKCNAVCKYLYENIDSKLIKRVIYHSIFYENLLLEYCYKNEYYDAIDKVVFEGYDYYLEISTLFIIRKYDYERYLNEIDSLKYICLSRIIKETSYKYSYLRDMYGEEFCDEINELASKSIKTIDLNDSSDPRCRKDRITPDWAK